MEVSRWFIRIFFFSFTSFLLVIFKYTIPFCHNISCILDPNKLILVIIQTGIIASTSHDCVVLHSHEPEVGCSSALLDTEIGFRTGDGVPLLSLTKW